MLSPRSSASPVLGPKAPKYGYHRLIGSWTPATLAIHSRMNTRTHHSGPCVRFEGARRCEAFTTLIMEGVSRPSNPFPPPFPPLSLR